MGLTPSCSWLRPSTQEPRPAKEHRAAVHDAFHLRRAHEDFVRLDLADDAHYQFARNKVREAAAAAAGTRAMGATSKEEAYSHAMNALESARKKALLQKMPGTTTSPAAPSTWSCDHFLTVKGGEAQDGQQPFTTGAYATCEGGATYVFTTVTAHDSDADGKEHRVLASGAGEEHQDGRSFDDVALKVGVPADQGRKLVVDSMMIATNQKTGEEHISFATLDTASSAQNATWTLQHPRFAGPAPHPQDNLTTCQLRGGSDCDYAMVSNQSGTLAPFSSPASTAGLALRKTAAPWAGDPDAFFPFYPAGAAFDTSHIYIPVQVDFDAGLKGTDPCIIQSAGSLSRVRLLKKVSGGTCSSKTPSLPSALTPGAQTATLTRLVDVSQLAPDFIPPPGSTAPNPCTMERIINEPVDLLISLQAFVKCGNVTESRIVNISSPALTSSPFHLNVLNSCMAEGTRITRADGETTPIEQLRIGDTVRASADGRVLTIRDVIHGHEPKPLVRLRDTQGHEVRLTEQHPVLLASGRVIAAVDVKVKDTVRTERGSAAIVSVERVPYDGRVFNLVLGTPEELATVGPNERTMFADGVLVGDDAMQRELGAPRQASRERAAPAMRR
ncbi:Hint domain-containing protein [Pyxidicoccus xibeiensis]|uniref:Hint domain-containing protein n=1 Tax=Pyxidicoccus xibeiensis TaxID=2906759 RepID=UPI0020A6E9B9|nr:Hint domain-containing protein [Pyxidicoccus xibeiensis]MCP3144116.1 Hint domain-containing protein [Pyxidicoccus xibeiensis]